MINLETEEIVLHDQTDKITHWDVWFSTPKGLFTTLEKALEEMKLNDWPVTVIQPVPVAIGENLYEPV